MKADPDVPTAMLKLEGLSAHYGDLQVLRGVDLEVHEGEVVTLVGSNGAGKTTTMNAISGLLACTGGSIRFCGQPISAVAAHRRVDMGLVQVPEGRRLFPFMTTRENIDLGCYSARARKESKTTLEAVLALLPALKTRLRQLAGTLSGGEQQMLALARALMGRPRLLMLDEPSLGLAPLIVREIFRIVRELNEKEGLTVLVVEQDARIALNASATAYVLEVGKVAVSGSSAELRDDEAVRRSYLGY